MMRASSAFRFWAVAFFAAVGAGGCFSDPAQENACNPGMEGCACVDLECEQGLSCQGGVCMGPVGTGSETGSSTAVDVTTTPGTSSTSTSSTSGPGTTDLSTGAPSTSTSTSSTTAGESGERTSGSTGSEDLCGNFVTDPGEECDMGNGCNDDCTLEFHDCNPLTNFPCPAGQKCSWGVPTEDPFTANFTCSPFDGEPIGVGDGDCFEGNDAQDQKCDVGLACFLNTFLETCNDDGGCCTEYCDTELADEDQCSIGGTTCQAEDDLAPGLDTLGVCR